ncbi:MAG: hypothetical protein NTX52_08130 [Planctomycetota bacterium]|nr:hypothetical protein [Planctomycetota bacterium]
MDKEQIKQKLLQAIRSEPNIKDIKSVDVDVLIEFVPDAHIGLFKLVDIKDHLEKFVGREIDIVTPEALSKYFRDEILAQAESVYEKR